MITMHLEISSATFGGGGSSTLNSVYLTLVRTASGWSVAGVNDFTNGVAGPPTPLTFTTGGDTYEFTAADLTASETSPGDLAIGGTSTGGSGPSTATLDLLANEGGSNFTDGSSVTANGSLYSIDGSHIAWSSAPPCFAAGTLLRTPRGEVAIESLTIGDQVITAGGETRPVMWIGHADVDFRAMPDATDCLPIRIAAEAFGPGRPSQDLALSPDHSVCVDVLGEVLIPVGRLINGSTIARIEVDMIAYWHVELESHDILIANNLPAESYLAVANRAGFDELRGVPAIHDEGRERTQANFCRPVVTEGQTLGFIRQRLDARARALGWTPSTDPELRLSVDGEILVPLIEEGVAAFLFPSSAKDVRLLSNTFRPKAFGTNDGRTLGVMLLGVSFCGQAGEPRRIRLDDQRLGISYMQESRPNLAWRWTDGEAKLNPELWAGLTGCVSLLVSYTPNTIRKWNAPAVAKKAESADKPRLYAVG